VGLRVDLEESEDRMKVKWNFDCGYLTRIPDFKLKIPDEDIEGLSNEQRDIVIWEYVQQEFENRIVPHWEIDE
jgi:hypothetical protein